MSVSSEKMGKYVVTPGQRAHERKMDGCWWKNRFWRRISGVLRERSQGGNCARHKTGISGGSYNNKQAGLFKVASFVYAANGYKGKLKQCGEGALEWVDSERLYRKDLIGFIRILLPHILSKSRKGILLREKSFMMKKEKF